MKKITKIKAKYYSREFLRYLLLGGAIYIASFAPYFTLDLMKRFKKPRKQKRKFTNAFNYLKRKGLIELEKKDHDIIISLTPKGKKLAGKYQIDDLELERPKKWDGKYRVVIFDIPSASRIVRDIFRRKLKEFGFYSLQKSVWIYPFDCKEEIKFLRDFFGMNAKQIQVLEVTKLEDDRFLKNFFRLT